MHKHRLLAPAIFLIAILVWTLVAPEEETLENAVRWVYLHVAFTWAGAGVINFAGVLGIVLLVRPFQGIARWMFPLELVAVGLYAFGFLISLVSAWVAWGGVLWQEPRVITSLVVIVAGFGALLALRRLQGPRVAGLVAILYAVLLSYQLGATRVVFHPEEPIDASESTAIRLTFYGLTILAIALGVSFVWFLGPRRQRNTHEGGRENDRQTPESG